MDGRAHLLVPNDTSMNVGKAIWRELMDIKTKSLICKYASHCFKCFPWVISFNHLKKNVQKVFISLINRFLKITDEEAEAEKGLITCTRLPCLLVDGMCLVAKSCLTLMQPHGLYPSRLLCPWGFSGKNTGVGCHVLL